METALLEGILDRYDEDGPRLVYADWLQDRAQPGDAARARFIRCQCRQALLPKEDPSCQALAEEANALLQQHRQDWLPRWRWQQGVEHWRRGFCRGQATWFKQADSPRFPAILDGHVSLHGRPDQGFIAVEDDDIDLIFHPVFARVTSYRMTGRWVPALPLYGDSVIQALTSSPHSRRIRELQIIGVSPEGAQALLETANLPQLRCVVVYYQALNDPLLVALKERFAATPQLLFAT